MQMICKSKSLKEMFQDLKDFPETLSGVYTQVLEKISKQSSPPQKRTIKILSWIFRAKRPLLVRELQQAMNTSIDESSGSYGESVSVSMMVEWCLGLVKVDEERTTIRFVHSSVKQFLQDGPFCLDSDGTVATTCLAFLNSDEFAGGSCVDARGLDCRLSNFPFLNYAAPYWAIHGEGCSETAFENLAIKLLCSEGNLACATQVAAHAEQSAVGYGNLSSQGISGLHIVAFYGLAGLVDRLLQKSRFDIEVKDEQGQTPILYAAKQGHEPVVKLLAGKGAQVDVSDRTHQRSTLSWATLNGHTSVVKWLLSHKSIDINKFDYQHSTPLHLAFERHHYDIVDLLVAKGASLNTVDPWQRTPAQSALVASSQTDVENYSKDKQLSKMIAQGGQATVAVFRSQGAVASPQVGCRPIITMLWLS